MNEQKFITITGNNQADLETNIDNFLGETEPVHIVNMMSADIANFTVSFIYIDRFLEV